jgi:glycosyltransferase involved in cell wall biosynthesis
MKISLIQPSRNNLKYLKWSYDSIRKNQGDHEVEICVADDASTDGTWDWCLERMDEDKHFKAIRNETGNRLGHTILYDRLVNEVATNDICMIYHADMYLCPHALSAIEKHIKPKVIVSLTRIEPPLHPEGPEKILRNFGTEPEEFTEDKLLADVEELRQPHENDPGFTEGIFAPWAFYKKDFQEINGHDPLYAPQSKEDSDIFNRFQLNGVKFIQTWEGFVYHMTCRGSRRNVLDAAKNIYEDSPEWLAQNVRSTRNFIRKWGHFVMHDEYLKPIIPSKFNVGFKVTNCDLSTLHQLEPWCDKIYLDSDSNVIEEYISKEQVNTQYNLKDRIFNLNSEIDTDVIVEMDAKNINYNHIQQLSMIIDNTDEVGEFELDGLNIKINKINRLEKDLIIRK